VATEFTEGLDRVIVWVYDDKSHYVEAPAVRGGQEMDACFRALTVWYGIPRPQAVANMELPPEQKAFLTKGF
jgi:hypothetical protein